MSIIVGGHLEAEKKKKKLHKQNIGKEHFGQEHTDEFSFIRIAINASKKIAPI